MRITGPGSVRTAEVRRPTRSPGGGKEHFHLGQAGEEQHAPAVSAATPLASVDTVLALQQVDQRTPQRERATRRGHQLLDRLDEIRHGLLVGAISGRRLFELKAALERERDAIDDPRLSEILDEIELRAAVELAKLEAASGSIPVPRRTAAKPLR